MGWRDATSPIPTRSLSREYWATLFFIKHCTWHTWPAFSQTPVPQMNFTHVPSVWNPMMTTYTKPSSWIVTTHSALTVSSNFHKCYHSIQPSSNAPAAGLTHNSQTMEYMGFKQTSMLQVFKSIRIKLKQKVLLQTSRAVLGIITRQYPIFAWHAAYLFVLCAQLRIIQPWMDILSSGSQNQKLCIFRSWISATSHSPWKKGIFRS